MIRSVKQPTMPELGWDQLSDATKDSILWGMETGEVPHWPKSVQVDWTDQCNARCFFCSQTEMRQGGHELSVCDLERLLDDLNRMNVSSIEVSGGGDPLFHRKIGTVLDAVANHDIRIGTITTNGIMAGEHITEQLISVTTSQITVSLNACTPRSYSNLMGIPRRLFRRVVDNIKALVATSRSSIDSRPKIAIQFLIYDATFRLLPKMYALARELGVDRVVFNPLYFPGNVHREILLEQRSFLADVKRLFQEDDGELIADILTIHPSLNDQIRSLRTTMAPDRYARLRLMHRNLYSLNTYCAIPWFHAHVTARGSVYPCCALLNQEFASLGNIHSQPLEQIWLGEPYRRFRSAMAAWPAARRAGRDGGQEVGAIPEPCSVFGRCFLRALPYIEETDFATKVDLLGRPGHSPRVRIPSRLHRGQLTRVHGTLSRPTAETSSQIVLKVNHIPALTTASTKRRFHFDFHSDPLEPGLHLLEVVDSTGGILSSRMVEVVDH